MFSQQLIASFVTIYQSSGIGYDSACVPDFLNRLQDRFSASRYVVNDKDGFATESLIRAKTLD